MTHSLYETRLQGIMVVVFIKKKHPVQDDESLIPMRELAVA